MNAYSMSFRLPDEARQLFCISYIVVFVCGVYFCMILWNTRARFLKAGLSAIVAEREARGIAKVIIK